MTTKLGRCTKMVFSSGDSWNRYACSLPAKVIENGKPWCTIHAPSYVKAKQGKKAVAWKADYEACRSKEKDNAHRIECYTELLAALELALPAIRWGMTHQPGNMNQWLDCEAAIEAAIAKAKGEVAHDAVNAVENTEVKDVATRERQINELYP